MARGESRYPQDWFRIALKDLQRVGRRLAERDAEDAAFHLQQAIEKSLKGYLLAQGWRLKRIHDVEALLSEAVRYDAKLERHRALCQQVAGYYLVERYPTFEEGPSIAEVKAAYVNAQTLIHTLRSEITRSKRR